MATATELERLRERALADPRQEAAYLRALLSATLYAHLPLSDDSGRMRLVMFTRPDGLAVIPVFTDLTKAHAAAGGHVRVTAVPGRDLLEATRGAILMLDPNDLGTTLYPEEIVALLDEGRVATAPVAFNCPALELLPPVALRDGWLLDVLETALTPIDAVRRVHLAAARPTGAASAADRLLVVLEAPQALVERAARAIAVALEGAPQVPWLPIDLASYEPGEIPVVGTDSGLDNAWTRPLTRGAAGRDG